MTTQVPRVTVCVPAYQAEPFIAETLRCVQDQTFSDLKVIVSIDPSTDATEDICRGFAAEDPRFEVHVQEHRLGWLGNTNYLFEAVDTELFFYLANDDLIHEDYVGTLLAALDGAPGAVNAYADIELHGRLEQLFVLDIVGDSPFERMLSFLSDDPSGIPLLGPTRTEVLRHGVRLREHPYANFLADQVWVLELLALGECVRVPEPLYRKWLREGSVEVSVRGRWSREVLAVAWVEHTLACMRAIASFQLPGDERHRLLAACLARLRRQLLRDGQLDVSDRGGAFDELALTTLLLGRALGLDSADGAPLDLAASLGGEPVLRSTLAGLRYLEGIGHRDRGAFGAAEALLAEAARLDPTAAEIHLQQSTVHYALNRPHEGLAMARRAAELDPTDARAQLMISRLQVLRGDLEAGEEAARRALELDPDHPEVRPQLDLVVARRSEVTMPRARRAWRPARRRRARR